tara:strand:- start:33104 stop:33307 length:204 start_codon:yes stop_codon:yes gene_type:complete
MVTIILIIVVLYFLLNREMPLKNKENDSIYLKILGMFGLILGHTLKIIGYVLTAIFDGINNVLRSKK